MRRLHCIEKLADRRDRGIATSESRKFSTYLLTCLLTTKDMIHVAVVYIVHA